MYGLVKALEDAREVDLLFADKKQAESFVRFVEIYIAESGAGNGYGAYWHYRDEPTIGVDTKTGRGNLKLDLIESMSLSICAARMARPPARQSGVTEPEYMPQVGVKNGVITFNFDPTELPPRIQPEAGDLVRIVDNDAHEREIARVKERNGANVVLVPCLFSAIKQEIELPLEHTMKIHDSLNGE